jgi:hypothetical protein
VKLFNKTDHDQKAIGIAPAITIKRTSGRRNDEKEEGDIKLPGR